MEDSISSPPVIDAVARDIIEAAVDVAWYVTVALSTVAILAIALPALRKPPPPPHHRRRRGLRRTFGGAAAVAVTQRAAGFLPLAVQRTYLLLSLGFALVSGGAPVVVGLWERAPTTACAAALQLLAEGRRVSRSGAPGHRRLCCTSRDRRPISCAASVVLCLGGLRACSITATAPVGAVFELACEDRQ